MGLPSYTFRRQPNAHVNSAQSHSRTVAQRYSARCKGAVGERESGWYHILDIANSVHDVVVALVFCAQYERMLSKKNVS